MPIMIDTNQDNLDEQLKQVTSRIALNKQVDAKYFSKNLTGNGKRKAGFFAHNTDTIDEFIREKRRLLDNVPTNSAHLVSQSKVDHETYGEQFVQNAKNKKHTFQRFETALTTMIPPVILERLLTNNIPVALTFPKQSAMYNLNALENTWTELTKGTIDGQPATTYVKPVVESITLYDRERKVTTQANKTKSQVSGQPDIYVLVATVLDNMDKNGNMIFINGLSDGGRHITQKQGVVSIFPLLESTSVDYDYTRLLKAIELKHFGEAIASHNIPCPTKYQLKLVIGDQSLYDILTSQAMTTTHQAKDALITFVDTFAKRMTEIKRKPKYDDIHDELDQSMVAFIQHIDILNSIEENLITTDLLSSIYNALATHIKDQKQLNSYARHSLRLLLSQRLHQLEEIKTQGGLYRFEPKNQTVEQNMKQNPRYSSQQKRIITTTDPLVIGQAGAGSGKSHTLVGRINYLRDQGEDLKKALVLSFTNVAAININNRFPEIRSETLANMFHTIYSATFPAQSLSQPSTVANSLRLLNPSSQYFVNLGLDPKELAKYIERFASHLEEFDQTGFKRVDLQQALKNMSNLIENNLDMTTHILNAVEQTTLELEPIIIHHKLLLGGWGLNIPKEYQELNYIITDESQDISTFEYILLIELTLHYRSQLLIIGDGSQTLYEFRNSDPRYLNALEESNVFTSYKLETNYRSNEEILMFANQFLQVIDANKFAKIQLKSAQFSTPTEQSVRKVITLDNVEGHGRSQKDYIESLTEYFENSQEFRRWFLDRVRNGEQVAITGWTRKEVLAVGEVIEKILAQNNLNIEITNIMSNNERPMTILSRFARDKQKILRSMSPTHPQYVATLDTHVYDFVRNTFRRASVPQQTYYSDVIKRNIRTIIQSHEWRAWVTDFRAGKVNAHQVGSFMIQQLLRLETRKNAMDQFLRKQKEVPNYDECPIILSTIHGTKGLEFDHTVVLFNEMKNGATSQESLRMMFVALSRAKKSEFIVNMHSASKLRSITDNLSGMYQTPMNTAYLRTLNDVIALNQNP